MDPVGVLPPELVLRICSLLHIDDLVQLWELNHHWRQIVAEPSLWRLAELDLSRACNVPNSLRVLRRAPCLGSIFYSAGDITEKLKDALLETEAVVLRLENVSVDDPHWINQLIQHFGPNLKELSIWYPNEEVLNTVNTLPLLVKLQISNGNDGFGGLNCTLQVPDGFAGSLKSFSDTGLYTLPHDQLVSLLSSHSRTLENVYLTVGISSDDQFDWPESCDLLNLLDKCKLKALRYLVLDRPLNWFSNHCRESCCVQLAAVRKFLPRVTVACTICHKVDVDCFYP